MSVLESLTPDQRDALARELYAAANELGYCDESLSVLEQVGLSVPETEYEVTIKVRVSGHATAEELSEDDAYAVEIYLAGRAEVDSYEVVSVEQS